MALIPLRRGSLPRPGADAQFVSAGENQQHETKYVVRDAKHRLPQTGKTQGEASLRCRRYLWTNHDTYVLLFTLQGHIEMSFTYTYPFHRHTVYATIQYSVYVRFYSISSVLYYPAVHVL
jgi:hypothetical protein